MLLVCACAEPSFPSGTFVDEYGYKGIDFSDDGHFTVVIDSKRVNEGTFSVQGNNLTWETDRECKESVGAEVKATYSWTFKKDTLVFKVIGEDKCSNRLFFSQILLTT